MKRDYHGFTIDEALQSVELIIGEIRNNNETKDVTFITGRGPIRKAVIVLLKEYKLDPHIKLGNTGAVIVTID